MALVPTAEATLFPRNRLHENADAEDLSVAEALAALLGANASAPQYAFINLSGEEAHTLDVSGEFWPPPPREGPRWKSLWLFHDDWIKTDCFATRLRTPSDPPVAEDGGGVGELYNEFYNKTVKLMVIAGSRGAGFFNHSDGLYTASWHAQIVGDKWWHICGSRDGEHSPWECFEGVVRPGEVLYYPPKWHHETRIDSAISVTLTEAPTYGFNALALMEQLLHACALDGDEAHYNLSDALCDHLDRCREDWVRGAVELAEGARKRGEAPSPTLGPTERAEALANPSVSHQPRGDGPPHDLSEFGRLPGNMTWRRWKEIWTAELSEADPEDERLQDWEVVRVAEAELKDEPAPGGEEDPHHSKAAEMESRVGKEEL